MRSFITSSSIYLPSDPGNAVRDKRLAVARRGFRCGSGTWISVSKYCIMGSDWHCEYKMWLFAPGSLPPAKLLKALICRCLLAVMIACALGRLTVPWQVGFTGHRTNQCHHPNSKVQTFHSAEYNKTCYLSPWLSLWLISPQISWFSASCPSFPPQFSLVWGSLQWLFGS